MREVSPPGHGGPPFARTVKARSYKCLHGVVRVVLNLPAVPLPLQAPLRPEERGARGPATTEWGWGSDSDATRVVPARMPDSTRTCSPPVLSPNHRPPPARHLAPVPLRPARCCRSPAAPVQARPPGGPPHPRRRPAARCGATAGVGRGARGRGEGGAGGGWRGAAGGGRGVERRLGPAAARRRPVGPPAARRPPGPTCCPGPHTPPPHTPVGAPRREERRGVRRPWREGPGKRGGGASRIGEESGGR
jgi:hypothetical protein